MTSPYGNGASPPLIVRVAGLPAEVMQPFSHARLIEVVARGEQLDGRLAGLRAALMDRLHAAIRTAARQERGFLLAVKRSCFNAGELRDFRRYLQWPVLIDVANALVDEIVALEAAVEENDAQFDELYARAVRQERESLVGLLGNQAFVRGITLASPDLAQHLDRLNGREPDSFGRREKKLCLTLLRYASRAALKLSPFSTLTRTGIALATAGTAAGFTFPPDTVWRDRSTVALRRELLEQCSDLLLRSRTFAAGLQVEINETLTREDDDYSFFRPGRWEIDASRAFRYREPAFVKVRLDGPLIPWLMDGLHREPQTCRDLFERAHAAFDEAGSDLTVESIATLLDIGFLSLTLPWDFSGPDLERRMLDHLDALPDLTELGEFRDRLRELTGMLDGYAAASSPFCFLAASKRGVEKLFLALAAPAGLDARIEFKAYERTFEETLFLQPGSGDTGGHEIARLSLDRARSFLADLDPLVRLIHLNSSVHDFLLTLAAFGERRWPGVREIGLLELFGAARPLFNDYLRYRAGLLAGNGAPPEKGFNPLELVSLTALDVWRRRVAKGLGGCFLGGGPPQRLCPRSLRALLDQVPAAPAASCAFCAFLQPADPEGGLWVLNSLNEGFGRLGSRFTLGMDDEARAYWAASFTPLSVFDVDGEPVELIDMACRGPRTINVHIPQTRRVLKMPGERPAVAPERLLRLGDLRVRLLGADRPPVLTDATARRLIPVPLGSLAAGARPTLLKFLALFGPRELRQALPTRVPHLEHGVPVLDRHLLGEIVYSRRKWRLEAQLLRSMMDGHSEAATYKSVNRWRLTKGLPELVFVQEAVAGPGWYRQKPQYIDFSSPSFLQILRSILRPGVRGLTLEEALPEPDHHPLHEHRWATEIQLESFAFRDCNCLPLVACERKQQQPAQQA